MVLHLNLVSLEFNKIDVVLDPFALFFKIWWKLKNQVYLVNSFMQTIVSVYFVASNG